MALTQLHPQLGVRVRERVARIALLAAQPYSLGVAEIRGLVERIDTQVLPPTDPQGQRRLELLERRKVRGCLGLRDTERLFDIPQRGIHATRDREHRAASRTPGPVAPVDREATPSSPTWPKSPIPYGSD